MDPNEEFIQGTWTIVNDTGTGSLSTRDEFFQWRFSNGSFSREQEIDRGSPLFSQGSYRVVSVEGDRLTLELFDIRGDRISYNNEAFELLIILDREGDTLDITNTLFTRLGP